MRAIMAAAMLAGCAAASVETDARPAECVALFQRFDALERFLGTPFGAEDRAPAQPELMRQGQVIQRAGCLTLTRELAAMSGSEPAIVADGGPAIRSMSLHAGVVTNMADDARALAFFEAAGVRARSVGSAALGRRVYLGPFGSEGAFLAAAELARDAGFASPYPAEF